jgi:hypothetical protein
MRNKALWVGLLLLLVLISTFLSACSKISAANQPFLVWNITVSKVEVKDVLESVQSVTQYNGTKSNVKQEEKPAAGNVFVIINLEVKKDGSDTKSFDWKQLSLRDASGNLYQRHPNDTFLEQFSYTPRLSGLEIRFGDQSGWVCFEVPASAANGKLEMVYSGSGSQQTLKLTP